MACRGYNHSPNCNCGFGAGHGSPASARPASWKVGKSKTIEEFKKKFERKCRKCGAVIYYVPSGKAGAYFDRCEYPWPKHYCYDSKMRHDPFNKDGTPKLRNKKTKEEQDGWLPLFILECEPLVDGLILVADALGSKGSMFLGVPQFIEIAKDYPLQYRERRDYIEIAYFDLFKSKYNRVRAYKNCKSPIELMLAKKNRTI